MNNLKKILKNHKVHHIQLRNMSVKSRRIVYGGFSFFLPKKLYRFELIGFRERLRSAEKEVAIVTPLDRKADKVFYFLHQSDEDYIINLFRSSCVYSTSFQSRRSRINPTTRENFSTVKSRSGNLKSIPQPNKNIIATNVQAFQLKINKGIIRYTVGDSTFVFKSVRISRNVSQSILERIEHYFTLVRDFSIPYNGNKELAFRFEPANDLSFLLAEIERLSKNNRIKTDKSFPESGEFEIPWRFVQFYDGILMISHPNPSRRGTYTPYRFRHSDILKSFEDIRFYIEKRSPKLRVQAADGVIVGLLNFNEFRAVISQYKDWEKAEDISFVNPSGHNNISGITKETFMRCSIIRKSPYLSYLSSLQNEHYRIIYLLERVIHESGQADIDEFGYLFVIKKSYNHMILLYENITDFSRSSILFYINPDQYQQAVEIIRRFLASEIKNKRQKLSYGQIRFTNPCIQLVKRIKHTNLTDWKNNLKEYL